MKLSESLARPDRRQPRARTRPGQEPASCAAPLGRRGPPRASPASKPPSRGGSGITSGPTSARSAGRRVPTGRCAEAQPGVRESAGRCALDSVYDEQRGLPWVGGCSGACGRCTSSCGRTSPARSHRTFRSRVSAPKTGLAGLLGSPGLLFAALDRRPRERSARAETGKFALGHPCSPTALATGMCEFFFQKRRKVRVAGGAGSVWPPLCGQERRCELASFEARPHPRKGKFEKLVIWRRQGNSGLELLRRRPPKQLAHLGPQRPVAMLRAHPGLAEPPP